MNKENLRKAFLEKRDALTKEEVEEKSKVIIQKLLTHPKYQEAKTVLYYMSKDNEVLTQKLVEESFGKKRVILPRTEGSKLRLFEITSLDQLELSKFGILEPKEGKEVTVEEVDLILVPGLSFDKEGNRLGFGLGCYDRLLETYKGYTIALAYDFQVVENLPIDDWDVAVKEILYNK